MLEIHDASHSRAFRVIWLANEIGIPYEHVPVTFSVPNAQCKEPWYVALNPNGKTPFFGGDRWDMGDFMVACVLYVLTRLKLDLTACPKLEAWLIASINRRAAQVARKLRET